MSTSLFSAGTRLLWGEVPFTVMSLSDDGEAILSGEGGATKDCTLQQLESAFAQSEIVFADAPKGLASKKGAIVLRGGRTLSDFSPKAQARAKRARNYLEGLSAEGPIFFDASGLIEAKIAKVATALDDLDPPSRATVWRWKRSSDAAAGDPIALVPRFDEMGGAKTRRRDPKVAEIEDKVIEEMYMRRNGPSVRDVQCQVDLEIRRENLWRTPERQLTAPSEGALRDQIARMDVVETVTARLGQEEARRRLAGNGAVPHVSRKLERVEIDATPLDLFVIDTETGQAWGRPTLYAGIDYKTKLPWGMHIAWDDCSASAALECIAHGILPKAYVKERYPELTGEWLAHGIPKAIRVDNGSELHSASVKDAAFEIGFDVEFCPKRRPNWKGSIERFLKTVNFQLCHTLPGTSLAKYWKRGDYDPLKAAVVDMTQLLKIMHLWMIDIYPRQFHRGIGTTPNEAWKLSK